MKMKTTTTPVRTFSYDETLRFIVPISMYEKDRPFHPKYHRLNPVPLCLASVQIILLQRSTISECAILGPER